MNDILAESINVFPPFVTIPASLLASLQDSLQALQDEVVGLRATVARQDEKIAELESTQEHEVNRICLDIALDRQRLKKLEMVELGPLQKDRAEILRALITANGGKMLAKDARQKMRLDKATFSRLLATSGIDSRPLHSDKRKMLLTLK